MSLGDIRNLDYAVLLCSRMQDTKDFYLRVMGFPLAHDACHEALQSKGVSILTPPRDIPSWRHRALFFRDPEGNVVELYAET